MCSRPAAGMLPVPAKLGSAAWSVAVLTAELMKLRERARTSLRPALGSLCALGCSRLSGRGGGQGMEQGHADHIPGGMAGNRTRLSLCKTDQRSRVPAQGLSSSLWVRNQLPPATSWVGCAPGAVLRAPGTLCLWLTMPLAQEASFRSSMAFLRCWSCVLILSLRQGGLQSSGSCVVPSPRCDVLTPRLLAC